MKLFRKKISSNGRTRIYFCGIKIASYGGNYYSKHFKRFKKKHKINLDDKNIVSLGMNCLPRTFLTQWGLKRSKEEGELSYPFDLAIHFTPALSQLLKNKFDGFLDNFEFQKSNGFWLRDGAKGFWINKKYGFLYVHDEDCGENDKEKLKKRLGNRLKNWQKMIKDKKPVYFVLYLDTQMMKLDKKQTTKASTDIAKTIFKIRGKLPTKLIVISTENIKIDMNNVFVLYSPLPWETYRWFGSERYTRAGAKFEEKIARFCYNVLSGQKG